VPSYSHSKLSTYENCPRQYSFRYIERIKLPEEPEGVEAFLGSRVHETLEKLYKELTLSRQNSLEELLDYYQNQWDRNWHENVLIVKKGFTKEHYFKTGQRAIRDYYNRYTPFSQARTIATEHMINFKIDGYTIQGFIDRLSNAGKGIYEIHDYKTSGSLPEQTWLDADRQLALYQIGIRERFRDVKDIKLIWHYLLFDQELTSVRSEQQLAELKQQIVGLIKKIEKDTKYEPQESSLCDWCEYQQLCPAKKHLFKVADLPPNKYLKDKGVSLVNKYAALKEEIKSLREQEQKLQNELDLVSQAAVEYAQKEEITSIDGSDFILKIRQDTDLDFPLAKDEDREEFEKAVKKAGIWDSVSTLNLPRLKKLIEEEEISPAVAKKILEFAETKNKVSVRLTKKEHSEE